MRLFSWRWLAVFATVAVVMTSWDRLPKVWAQVGPYMTNPVTILFLNSSGASGQSVAVSPTNPLPLQSCDPSSGNCAAVKAASTAAAQTDKALVTRNPDLGTISDAAWSVGDGTVIAILKAVANNAGASIPAGSNLIGATSPAAATTGGASMSHLLSAASTNSTSVKGSAGTLYAISAINTTATVYYLKFYDKASAPTCNSDTVLMTLPVPSSTSGAGLILAPAVGFSFSAGIGLCLTGAAADNDNTNAATGVTISLGYK